MDMSSCRLNR